MNSLLMKPLDAEILAYASDSIFALSLARPNTLQAVLSKLVEMGNPTVSELIQKLVEIISTQQQNQHQKLQKGEVVVGLGSPGLERFVSLNPYRKLFAKTIMEARLLFAK